MGGLTVLAALMQRLPDQRFVYLGDTARLPYGSKTSASVVRYADQAAQCLVERGVKALVVACNTAAAVALPSLRNRYPQLPIFGVVEPGAAAAVAAADESGVLVLATETTVLGGAYQKCLLRQRPALRVFARSCPLWVTLAEQGGGSQLDELSLTVIKTALRGFIETSQTIVLGCTHFPVFRSHLLHLLGSDRVIVDSAQTTATVVAAAVGQAALHEQSTRSVDPMQMTQFLATDGVDRFRRVGEYFLGQVLPAVEWVDL